MNVLFWMEAKVSSSRRPSQKLDCSLFLTLELTVIFLPQRTGCQDPSTTGLKSVIAPPSIAEASLSCFERGEKPGKSADIVINAPLYSLAIPVA